MPFNPETGIYENDQPSYFPHTGGLAGVDILNPFRAQQLAGQAQEGRDIALHMQELMAEEKQRQFDNIQKFQEGVNANMSPEDMNLLAMQTGQTQAMNPFIGLQKAQIGADARVESAHVTGDSRENVAKIKTETSLKEKEMQDILMRDLAVGRGEMAEGGGEGPLPEAKAAHLQALTDTAHELLGAKKDLLEQQANAAGALAEYRRAASVFANMKGQGGAVTAKQKADILKAAADLRNKAAMTLKASQAPTVKGTSVAMRMEAGIKKMNQVATLLELAATQADPLGPQQQGPPAPPATPGASFTLPLGGALAPNPPAQ